MKPRIFAVQEPERWVVPSAMVVEDPWGSPASTAAFRSCVFQPGSEPALGTGTDSSLDRSTDEPEPSSRRVHWHTVACRASVGLLALSLLVGGGQPLEAQEVDAKRAARTAFSCKVLTATHIGRHGSITSALRSGINGLQLLYASGQAGTGPRIRMRGNSSIHGSLEPMVFVDGVRMTDDTPGAPSAGARAAQALDLIDPSDVLAIAVLSGPAGTALYGTDAAGGVIHVYSKRGDVDIEQDEVWGRCGR